MPEARIAIRSASVADFEAIERVAVANDEPTTAPRWPGWLYLENLLAGGTLLVAELDGRLVGFAGAVIVGGRRPAAHVTDLFVDPELHGHGAGGRLLRALVATVPVDTWTTCSSSDPRAMTLYVRVGMRPLWPVLYLDGPLVAGGAVSAGGGWVPAARGGVSAGGGVSGGGGVSAGAWSVPDRPGAAAALELAWSGRDFTAHYGHWAARPGGVAFRLELDGRTVAAGAVRDGRMGPGRVLDHLAIAPDADPATVLPAAIASAAVRGAAPAEPGAGEAPRLKLAVCGPSPALPVLLEHGFRITDHDTFMASDPGLVDPLRIVPDPSFG